MITMVLLVAASLIGINSIYQPANVETQPQPLMREPSKQFPGAGQTLLDNIFLDRMMPKIIQRMDGKVLAEKIYPHLSVGVRIGDSYGPLVEVEKDPLAPDSLHTTEARCPPGMRVMGGGGTISAGGKFQGQPHPLLEESSIVEMGPIPVSRFTVTAQMSSSGTILAYATCLGGASVGLK